MAKNPDHGETLDYGDGVELPRPTDPPKSAKPVDLEAEDFMENAD